MSADITTTAQDRAQQIRDGLTTVWNLLTDAYAADDWKTLGYSSWEAYCTGEFQGRIPRLAKSERGGVVQELADHGMPIKAIAAATGIARNTVRKDLRTDEEQPEGGQNDPSPMTREEAEELTADLKASMARMMEGIEKVRAERPTLHAIRRQHPSFTEKVNESLALIEHADGSLITDEEFHDVIMAALHGPSVHGPDRDPAQYHPRSRKPLNRTEVIQFAEYMRDALEDAGDHWEAFKTHAEKVGLNALALTAQDLEQIYVMCTHMDGTEVSDDEFNAALDACKAEGDISRESVIRKIQGW